MMRKFRTTASPIHWTCSLLLPVLFSWGQASCQPTPGSPTSIISANPSPGSMTLVAGGAASPILVSASDYAGVQRVAADFQADIDRVSGVKPRLVEGAGPLQSTVVIIGTVGKSDLIDRLTQAGKLDVSGIAGKWESFQISVVSDPMPGVGKALVIAGSDKRGTIYGTYECSEEAGVSPWYWWADVPPKRHTELYAKAGTYTQAPPAVKYRGIFINDEDPALSGWARAKFGGVNSKMYSHVFELLLRMRANFMWPAMWGKAFNEDDPEDPRLADEYGIVMGTSHHEPLMRAQAEWTHHHKEYGNGEWNYATNAEGLRKFWTDGVSRNRDYENIYTIGMRGDGDKAMPDSGGFEANKKLLETIMADQRQILSSTVSPDVTKIPQLWALFTEVQKYYDAGLKVPDDVTLLFTDDNVGNLRRVPTPEERDRSGGSGIYYHMDMNGGPFSYKWLNSNPLPKIREQMNLAYQYGADRIWLVNVGDIKPLEVPIEFFLRMAWNPKAFGPDSIQPYIEHWAEREFGAQHAAEIADIVAKYAKYNASPKPELIRPDTFSLINYREAERVSDEWTTLANQAQALEQKLPAEEHDAYYELVLHPVLACGTASQLYISAGRNRLFASQGRASANDEAALVQALFEKDASLTNQYNKVLAGGKWEHMMDQIHLGYTSWQTPHANLLPALVKTASPADGAGYGIAVEGSASAWPANASPVLPDFDSLHPESHYFEVFATGDSAPAVKITPNAAWIRILEGHAFSAGRNDRRYLVSVDWHALPAGRNDGTITVSGAQAPAEVHVTALKATPEESREAEGAFGALSGPIAFDATQSASRTASNRAAWRNLPDYGREDSAVTILPVTAESVKNGAGPALTYDVFLPRAGRMDIDLVTNPTLDIRPDIQLSVGVAVDNGPAEIESVFTRENRQSETFLGKAYNQNDRANARIMHFHQDIGKPGRHTFRIEMVDPTLVIEKVVLHDGPLPPSFFGPPSRPTVQADRPQSR